MRQVLVILLLIFLSPWMARAAEVIPPAPNPRYIVDQAHVLSPETLRRIDQQLEQFERDTSNQIVVALYPTMQSSDDIAAYAVRVGQAWHIGQKNKDNGVLLLAFTQDHKVTIQVGKGLEGALPDATCYQIIEQEIKPHFKANDYDGGVQAAVTAMIAATKGEYKGNGRTVLGTLQANWVVVVFIGIFVLLFVSSIIRSVYGTAYSVNGRAPSWVIPFILLSNLSSSRSGGSGGSSWGGGGGGGGFSGGGGSFGGGGASGSW